MFVHVTIDNVRIGWSLKSCRNGRGAYIYKTSTLSSDHSIINSTDHLLDNKRYLDPDNNLETNRNLIGCVVWNVNNKPVTRNSIDSIVTELRNPIRPLHIILIRPKSLIYSITRSSECSITLETVIKNCRRHHWLLMYIQSIQERNTRTEYSIYILTLILINDIKNYVNFTEQHDVSNEKNIIWIFRNTLMLIMDRIRDNPYFLSIINLKYPSNGIYEVFTEEHFKYQLNQILLLLNTEESKLLAICNGNGLFHDYQQSLHYLRMCGSMYFEEDIESSITTRSIVDNNDWLLYYYIWLIQSKSEQTPIKYDGDTMIYIIDIYRYFVLIFKILCDGQSHSSYQAINIILSYMMILMKRSMVRKSIQSIIEQSMIVIRQLRYKKSNDAENIDSIKDIIHVLRGIVLCNNISNDFMNSTMFSQCIDHMIDTNECIHDERSSRGSLMKSLKRESLPNNLFLHERLIHDSDEAVNTIVNLDNSSTFHFGVFDVLSNDSRVNGEGNIIKCIQTINNQSQSNNYDDARIQSIISQYLVPSHQQFAQRSTDKCQSSSVPDPKLMTCYCHVHSNKLLYGASLRFYREVLLDDDDNIASNTPLNNTNTGSTFNPMKTFESSTNLVTHLFRRVYSKSTTNYTTTSDLSSSSILSKDHDIAFTSAYAQGWRWMSSTNMADYYELMESLDGIDESITSTYAAQGIFILSDNPDDISFIRQTLTKVAHEVLGDYRRNNLQNEIYDERNVSSSPSNHIAKDIVALITQSLRNSPSLNKPTIDTIAHERLLLRYLTVELITEIIVAMILEYHIIITDSDNASIIPIICEWFKQAILFDYCHIYAPTIPYSLLHDLIACPVPYLIGYYGPIDFIRRLLDTHAMNPCMVTGNNDQQRILIINLSSKCTDRSHRLKGHQELIGIMTEYVTESYYAYSISDSDSLQSTRNLNYDDSSSAWGFNDNEYNSTLRNIYKLAIERYFLVTLPLCCWYDGDKTSGMVLFNENVYLESSLHYHKLGADAAHTYQSFVKTQLFSNYIIDGAK